MVLLTGTSTLSWLTRDARMVGYMNFVMVWEANKVGSEASGEGEWCGAIRGGATAASASDSRLSLSLSFSAESVVGLLAKAASAPRSDFTRTIRVESTKACQLHVRESQARREAYFS